MLGDALTEDRYTVTLIDAGHAQPVEQATESNPDLLIVDLRLATDELLGWQVAQAVRGRPGFERLPVLVCSGDTRALTEIEDELATMPRVATLTKPFGLDELEQTVARLLET